MMTNIFNLLQLLRDLFDYLSAFGKIIIDIEQNKISINIGSKWMVEIRSSDQEIIQL